MRLPKKTLIVLVSVVSLGLVVGAWAMSREDERMVFESSNTPLLEASPAETKAGFSSWEKDILTRQTATLPRNLLNYTDATSKDLLAEYLKARENDTSLNEEDFVQSFLENRATTDFQKEINYTEYKISDLKISTSNNLEALKKYGNKIGEISASNVRNSSMENELSVLTRAASSNNPAEFERLDPVINHYKKLVSEFLKIEVPKDAAVYHLEIVNSFSKMAGAIEGFKTFLEDPLRGLFILSSYSNYITELQNSLKDLNEYFKSEGVTFNESEYGFLIERAANATASDFQ